jgi:hypothetical protein
MIKIRHQARDNCKKEIGQPFYRSTVQERNGTEAVPLRFSRSFAALRSNGYSPETRSNVQGSTVQGRVREK